MILLSVTDIDKDSGKRVNTNDLKRVSSKLIINLFFLLSLYIRPIKHILFNISTLGGLWKLAWIHYGFPVE